jgi:SAM-dependent methyltransferase
MKRSDRFRPSIEDAVELSGIETLHPGGLALTQRTGEVGGLRPGLEMLDVSCGRGTQAIHYATAFGVQVTGIDISEEMVRTARQRAQEAGVADRTDFQVADSQKLPFADASFDVTVNECAVGIPDDSQAVLNEMVRVTRPGGSVVMHESTWRRILSEEEKSELSDRYGTTPLDESEWIGMLERAGVGNVHSEVDEWSKPEMFWKVRKDRDVSRPSGVLTIRERISTLSGLVRTYGASGVMNTLRNERVFFRAVLDGKVGYGLYWGLRVDGANA